MKVIRLELGQEYCLPNELSCCIGNFDGFHLGHQELVKQAKEIASDLSVQSAIISFDINPMNAESFRVQNLMSIDSKIKLAESFEVDYLILLHFDTSLKSLTPKQFNLFLLEHFQIESIVCGFDFKYGFQGKGCYKDLELDFKKVSVVESVNYLGEKISSSRIRNMIIDGKVSELPNLLGYHFFLEGDVIHGHQIGRSLGFPTANLMVSKQIILPKCGVYKAYTHIQGNIYSVLVNIGCNPTVQTDHVLRIEAHILDFVGDLYEKKIKIYFLDYLRDEQKFSSKEELAKQIEKDIAGVRNE